jgi:aminodeoxyfutalosine deaminase
MASLPTSVLSVPKAELHLHLEGSIQPPTVCALTRRHGVLVTEDEARQRYAYRNFDEFLEIFKWVTSFLRDPQDYALITQDLGAQLLAQGVVYAEITLSIGVMLLRKQNPEANFAAILTAAEAFTPRGLKLNFIFDAVRQFGAEAAMRVLDVARRCASTSIVAFGIGGDELRVATDEFRSVYHRAAELGFHRLIHAGEIGGPDKIREAVELLGAERIGHGIAAIRDPDLMDLLADRRIALEICPQSNLRTGALALLLDGVRPQMKHHPLARLFRHGIPIALSTDDPAMFHTTLLQEYENARLTGLTEPELLRVAQMSFDHAFISETEKRALLGVNQLQSKVETRSGSV